MQWVIFGIILICSIILAAIILFDDDGYFDTKRILKSYFKVFERDNKRICVIYALLLFIAFGMAYIKPVESELMNTITLIISVLCGAFLAFIPVVMGLENKSGLKETQFKKIKKETVDILMFELLVSLLTLFICLVYTFVADKYEASAVSIGFSLIIDYMVFVVIVNILVALKRIGLMITFITKNT